MGLAGPESVLLSPLPRTKPRHADPLVALATSLVKPWPAVAGGYRPTPPQSPVRKPHSGLLDAPRPDSEDRGLLRFTIAREIGHIPGGHRSFIYEFMTTATQAVPCLANPLLRADACTADRYAVVLAPDAAYDYFAVDAVSKDCWQDMSIRAAVARAGKVRLGQMITGLLGDVPPTVWRLHTLASLGIFNCGVKPSYAKTPAEFREYLKQIPTVPVAVADLKRYQGSFLLPPKPMPEEDLDRLVPRGTNLERLSEGFAAHETK